MVAHELGWNFLTQTVFTKFLVEYLQSCLGIRFKKASEKLSLTQAEVAEKAGIHFNYYARVERGEENPSFDRIRRIMGVLKLKSLDIPS